ncbi:AIPR family protein [Corynebacterium sp. HMSC08D02]|uniref:AIPR family protein n=1 Tax=Corynebacterium sp. HMSC08D02 TaxID=1581138 RepID=UPI0008A3B903|nr:AIPR family protein [Corynebacterium sp. HMSC08D02]OFT30677.1 hypothetical protein HMPREF3170_04005 [Corynebacterium sp. HMSC08D02]
MQVLTKSRLSDFCRKYDVDAKSESVEFEYYAAHHFLSRYVNNDIRLTEQTLIRDDDGGIDAIGILINGQFANDASDVEELIREDDENTVRIGFLQAKTSEKYDTKLIARFLNGVSRMTRAAGACEYSLLEPALREKAEALATIVDNISKFSVTTIPCDIFYVTLSDRVFGDGNAQGVPPSYGTQVDDELKRLKELNVYDFQNLRFVGQKALDERVEELRGTLEAKFKLLDACNISATGKIDRALIGVISVAELRKIILDDNSEVRERLFDENVRLYQGEDNEVNQAISRTLKSSDRSRFPFLNNGLTIITRELNAAFDQYHMKGYQIVNGCQTTNEIARWLRALGSDPKEDPDTLADEVLVPIKIIQTADKESVRDITVATNSQTLISKQDIPVDPALAMRVEEYFAQMPEDAGDQGRIKLRYKRQSGVSQNEAVPGLRTFDTRELSRAFLACIYGNSSTAIGQPNKANSPDSGVWGDNSEVLFYFSALMLYRVERALVRTPTNGIKPAKYHIAMLASRYVLPELSQIGDPAVASQKKLYKELARSLESNEWLTRINTGIELAIDVIQSHFSEKLKVKSLVKDDVRSKKTQESLLTLWSSLHAG